MIHTTTLIETFTATHDKKTITVPPGQSLSYLAILYNDAQIDFMITVSQDAHAKIKVLCIGSAGHILKTNVHTTLNENGAQAEVYILSLLQDGSDLNVHGNVLLAPNVTKVSGHLLEENIILGKNIKIRTAPILDVHSSDVSASHGCRIEKIDPKKLFYMQSRGLTSSASQALILDGYLNALVEGFDMDEDQLDELKVLVTK